jgi:rubrerythrin
MSAPVPAKVLEIIEDAIYDEQASHDYYLKMAEVIVNPSGRDQFRHLAQEEVRHREVLEERWRALTGKRFKFEPSKMPKDHAPVPTTNADAVQVLGMAMEQELDAVSKYKKLAESAEDEPARRAYLELAEDEQQHYEWFRAQRHSIQTGIHWFTETLPGPLER